MLTDEQRQKAYEALERKKAQDKEKRYAMMFQLEAYCDIHVMKILLPYRVLFDLHKAEYEKTFTEVFPNPYYPAPAMSFKLSCSIPHYMGDESKLPTKPFTYDGKTVEVPDKLADPEYRREWEEYQAKVKAEEMSNEKWAYWYARFLLPYDLNSFSDFDFWGEIPKDDEEKRIVQMFREECIKAQTDCKAHPEDYNSEPVERKEEHKTLYNVPYGYI